MCYSENLRTESFKILSRGGVQWLECPALARRRSVLHAFSTRAGGASHAPAAGLNLGFTEGDRSGRVEANRRLLFRRLGAGGFQLAELRQIHSTILYRVVRGARGHLEYFPGGYSPSSKAGARRPQGDALITDQPGILLAVRSADCVPILLADPDGPAVAAVHGGWRGLLEGLVEKTVGEMRRLFGSRPRRLLAAIGPSIRVCCYEVGEELLSAYCGRFAHGEEFFSLAQDDETAGEQVAHTPVFLSAAPPGHAPGPARRPHLDLVAVARYQLRKVGLLSSHIHVADYCTSCRTDLFFSHRQEGSRTGRMMALIGIRPAAKTGWP